MKKIKVLICDDSNFIRHIFSEMLSGEEDIEVIATATNPLDAREKIKQLKPDVLTLDIEMPNMDGISFLEKIMALRPMPVVMISTLTTKGATSTLKAMELGAIDYIAKPTDPEKVKLLKQELLTKVRIAANARIVKLNKETGSATFNSVSNKKPPLIVMGASTGGVEALEYVLKRLPENSPPILMVQHMPEQFTASFAKRLNGVTKISVLEAADGMKVEHGTAYLARGGQHLKVVQKNNGELLCKVEHGDLVSGHCPSVDVLFDSAAEVMKDNLVGVLLTGMGKDGAYGMLKMVKNGAFTIGQNQETCVVYGMPKVAFDIGGVSLQLPIHDIPAKLMHHCENKLKGGILV